jgi:AraC-like DNA-binding protein
MQSKTALIDDIQRKIKRANAPVFCGSYERFLSQGPINEKHLRSWPSGDRYIDDLIVISCFITRKESKYLTFVSYSMLKDDSISSQFSFADGCATFPHKANFIEITYIAEGSLHNIVDGACIEFNKNEFFMLDKDSVNIDYLHHSDMLVFFLTISPMFFDKSRFLDTSGDEGIRRFLHDIVINRKEKYHYVHFLPRKRTGKLLWHSAAGGLVENIFNEMMERRPGMKYLVMGLVERFLNVLPSEYQVIIKKKDAKDYKLHLFDTVRIFLEENFRQVSIQNLVNTFGHNRNYYNNLIKDNTGIPYSRFLQDIRLRKAEYLLKTTLYNVEDISRKVGYENITFFYKLFTQKYGKSPNDLRREKGASG